MVNNRYIIACSGSGTRWNNYLNTKKHLIKIENETLLDRTIRLLKKFDPNSEICIFAFDKEYQRENTFFCTPTLLKREEHVKYPAVYMSREYWNLNGNTTILFGDIFFTENCIKKILENNNTLNFFGRKEGSSITGKKHGELFGMSFNKDEKEMVLNKLQILEQKFKKNEISRFITWELYRLINKIDLQKHQIKKYFIEINDLTDDFDFPQDYDIWIKKYHLYITTFRKMKYSH